MALAYSIRARKILDHESKRIALEFKRSLIGPDILLFSIIVEKDSLAVKALQDAGTDLKILETDLKKLLLIQDQPGPEGSPVFSEQVMEALSVAEEEARLMISDVIGTEHILLGLLRLKDQRLSEILKDADANFEIIQESVYELLGLGYPGEEGDLFLDDFSEGEGRFEESRQEPVYSTKEKNVFLAKFSMDLTERAGRGLLDPVIGRERELERVIEILCRRQKNNPILVGDPGVGKTAIVEGLAQKIKSGHVPVFLSDKKILAVDLAGLVAGTKYRGEFEERIKRLINESLGKKNIILFIDEFHTIIGAGSAEGTLDAANMLKPVLARGDLQVIGATTFDEFRKYLERDKAIERRIQSVIIDEPDQTMTLSILMGIKSRYESFHNVTYTDQALEAAIELSGRYLNERKFPDKAIDLLDEAGAKLRSLESELSNFQNEYSEKMAVIELEKKQYVENQEFEKAIICRDMITGLKAEYEKKKTESEGLIPGKMVNKTHIEKVLASWLRIPVEDITEKEAHKLLKMEENLAKDMVGQPEAIKVIAESIRRSRSGLSRGRQPVASFVFIGPSGTGKTYLAKMLANFLFGNEDKLIRLDMSDFMEKFSVSRLTGSPPGYVGFENGGLLTEKVRKNPYCVVLFDEIEKAHPEIQNILLQILEEGQLADNLGHTVSFQNSIIIMTSNAGSRALDTRSVGFEGNTQDNSQKTPPLAMTKELKKIFSPELINRIDEIVLFNRLGLPELRRLVGMELMRLIQYVKKIRGVQLMIDEEVIEFLALESLKKGQGARPVRRVIQTTIENRISELLLSDKNSSSFSVSMKNGHITLSEPSGKLVPT